MVRGPQLRVVTAHLALERLDDDERGVTSVDTPTRQLQSGYDRAVFRYRIVARGTIEESAVIPRIRTKASVQDSLKSAMKQRKQEATV